VPGAKLKWVKKFMKKSTQGSHPSAMAFALSANYECLGILTIPLNYPQTVKPTDSKRRPRRDCGKKAV
jgi:hypothetical protein